MSGAPSEDKLFPFRQATIVIEGSAASSSRGTIVLEPRAETWGKEVAERLLASSLATSVANQ